MKPSNTAVWNKLSPLQNSPLFSSLPIFWKLPSQLTSLIWAGWFGEKVSSLTDLAYLLFSDDAKVIHSPVTNLKYFANNCVSTSVIELNHHHSVSIKQFLYYLYKAGRESTTCSKHCRRTPSRKPTKILYRQTYWVICVHNLSLRSNVITPLWQPFDIADGTMASRLHCQWVSTLNVDPYFFL